MEFNRNRRTYMKLVDILLCKMLWKGSTVQYLRMVKQVPEKLSQWSATIRILSGKESFQEGLITLYKQFKYLKIENI